MSKLVRRLITAVGTAVTVGAMTISPAFAGTPASGGVSVDTQRQQILAGINSARAQAGLGTLQMDSSIQQVAQGWANQLGQGNGALTHNPNFAPPIQAATGCSSIGEIVAMNGTSDKASADLVDGNQAVAQWTASSQHRDIMMSAKKSKIGIGVVYVADTDDGLTFYDTYWVANLAGDCTNNTPAPPVNNTPTPTPTYNPGPNIGTPVAQDGSVTYNGIKVKDAILSAFIASGAVNGSLGNPTGAQFGPLKNGGFGQHFQGGSIYWSQASGAQILQGSTRDRFAAQGWEGGWLGYPTSGQISIKGGTLQRFQGGLIYSSPATGSQAVRGAILDKFGNYGYENGRMGFPVTSEIGIRGGAFTAFQGGSVYWSPATGAHAVFGAIRDTWGSVGWENGFGFPTTDEFGPLKGGGYGQHFQGGSIYWSQASGGHTVSGAFRNSYAAQGWEGGRLGYPTSQEYRAGSEIRQNFQGGYMVWNGRSVTVR